MEERRRQHHRNRDRAPGAQFDDFDWRISLATITQDGPFSLFPGVDRALALVEVPGLVLDIDDSRRFVLGSVSIQAIAAQSVCG